MSNLLINYLDKSKTAYHAHDNAVKFLLKSGFSELKENEDYSIKVGGKYFISRDGSALIAFKVGENFAFNIVASHSDSPCFKLKCNPEMKVENYVKFNVERYGGGIFYSWFDMEKLCRVAEKHRKAHGLAGCVTAWCGQAPENQHRSDGDALATMHLMRAICRDSHIDAEMLITAFPECAGDTIAAQNAQNRGKNAHTGGRRRHHHRSRKKPNTNTQANAKGESK